MAHNVLFFFSLRCPSWLLFFCLQGRRKGKKKTAHFYCFENVTSFSWPVLWKLFFQCSCFHVFLAPAFFLNNFFIRENLVEHCFLAHDFFFFHRCGTGVVFFFENENDKKKKKTDKEACIAVSFSYYYYYQTGVGGARVYDRAQMTASSRTFKSETTAGDGK